MDGWLSVAGAVGLSLVVGWLLEPRLQPFVLFHDVGSPTFAVVIVLALVVHLAHWHGGLPSSIAAVGAVPAGVVAHRGWLMSLQSNPRPRSEERP